MVRKRAQVEASRPQTGACGSEGTRPSSPLGRCRKSRNIAEIGRKTPEDRLLAELLESGGVGRADGARQVPPPTCKPSAGRAVAAKDPLQGLLSSGAVAVDVSPEGCRLRVTDAGRARLRRQRARGDAFGAQHGVREVVSTGDGEITINAAESPLLWLKRRKGRDGADLLGDAEFAAGERLRSDFTLAHLMPRMGADWERQGGRGVAIGLTPGEARLAAQSAANALRVKQQEVDTLLADREHAGEAKVHEQKSVRLWQIVAVIAIVNILILLGMFLVR